MNTTEIVVGKMQGNRGLQMRQFLAERIRHACEPSNTMLKTLPQARLAQKAKAPAAVLSS